MDFYEKVSLIILKYFNKGYITSREKVAMFLELCKPHSNATYFTINSENRKILFTCEEIIDYRMSYNLDYVARLSVYTPQGDPDFMVCYSSESDKFLVDEPTRYKGDYDENSNNF